MTAINDVTGDLIKSKTNTKEYNDNYDRIFNKEKEDLNKNKLVNIIKNKLELEKGDK